MWWAQKCTLCGGYWMWRRGWHHVTFHIIYWSSFSLNFKFASSVSLVSQIALEIRCLVPGITGRLLLCLAFACVGDRSGELRSSLLYNRDPLNNLPRLFFFQIYVYVCMYVCLWRFICSTCAQCPQRSEGIRSSRTKVTGSWGPSDEGTRN